MPKLRADITFEFASIEDVTRLKIKKGQKFKLDVVDVEDPSKIMTTRWFTDMDPVLAFTTDKEGTHGEFEAVAIGFSELQIQDTTQTLQKRVYFEIVETTNTDAVTLNPAAEKPVMKP